MAENLTEFQQHCVNYVSGLMANRPDLVNQLTPATVQVCRLRAAGLSEKHIAELLGKSANTVHDHVKAIHQRLGITSTVELTLLFAMPRHLPGVTINA